MVYYFFVYILDKFLELFPDRKFQGYEIDLIVTARLKIALKKYEEWIGESIGEIEPVKQ